MEKGNSSSMRQAVKVPPIVAQAKTVDLMNELDNMNLGGK
jgi:hypothetical protein